MGLNIKIKLQRILEDSVKNYLKKNKHIKLILVVGSVGKTGTKIAIGKILSEKYKVRFHEGNYNTQISTPLSLLGVRYPKNAKNPIAWLIAIIKSIYRSTRLDESVEVIVQEVGTDRVGEIPNFGSYVTPDLCLVTAVSPEHMEFLGNMQTVAKEELSAVNYSKKSIINVDDIDRQYLSIINNKDCKTYGLKNEANFRLSGISYKLNVGYSFDFNFDKNLIATGLRVKLIGEHSLKTILAALAVGFEFGLTKAQLSAGLEKIRPVKGRMNLLDGVNHSYIIDDTYNSSPLALSSAIMAIRQLKPKRAIAIIGSMNELGDTSEIEHKKAGRLFEPSQFYYLITVGDQANKYLATAAESNGCRVKTFNNALKAAEFARTIIEPETVILVKGSQGQIFLEEATKMLLNNPADKKHLVRQSASWLKLKSRFFLKR